MTANTVKTASATNMNASPNVMADRRVLGAKLNRTYDVFAVATTSLTDIGSIILSTPINSGALITGLAIIASDLDSGGTALTVDIGVYNGPVAFVDGTGGTSYAAYAVIVDDAFASNSAALTQDNPVATEVLYANTTIANIGQPLWQLLGLTQDPNRLLVLGMLVSAAATTAAAGTVVVRLDTTGAAG